MILLLGIQALSVHWFMLESTCWSNPIVTVMLQSQVFIQNLAILNINWA